MTDYFPLLPTEVLMAILDHVMTDLKSEASIMLVASSPTVYRTCYTAADGKILFQAALARHCPWNVCSLLGEVTLSTAFDLSYHRRCTVCGITTVRPEICAGLRCHMCALCLKWFLVPESLALSVGQDLSPLRNTRRKAAVGPRFQRHFLLPDILDVSSVASDPIGSSGVL